MLVAILTDCILQDQLEVGGILMNTDVYMMKSEEQHID